MRLDRMTGEQLEQYLRALEDIRADVASEGTDPGFWDVEIAAVKYEIKERRATFRRLLT